MIFFKQDYSMELYSNSDFHSRNTTFSRKKMVRQGYYGNESLGLA